MTEFLAVVMDGFAKGAPPHHHLVFKAHPLEDGRVPLRAEITRRTHAALHAMDLDGIDPPVIREGTLGAQARALGAAAIPLSQRYLIDQNAAGRAG